MNFYVDTINNTIELIEERISEKLYLEDISKHFGVSEFHFNRMFRTVTGMTLKQYILGRKLSLAFEKLNSTNISVIDAAYDFGFDYPEVFSRAFKKQFGIAPSECRKEKSCSNFVDKAAIVERDIMNYKGSLTLKGICIHIDEKHLEGINFEADTNDKGFETLMRSKWDEFIDLTSKSCAHEKDISYSVVNCSGEGNGKYSVFYGFETAYPEDDSPVKVIPEGWYASFKYRGNMLEIRETFEDDLYRWIILQEIQLISNGIGMIDIYEKDCLKTGNVQILVPVKEPEKITGNKSRA